MRCEKIEKNKFKIALLSAILVLLFAGSSIAADINDIDTNSTSFALLQDTNSDFGTKDGLSTFQMFSRMIVAAIIILALGLTASYATRKFSARITTQKGKEIKILENVNLGNRKTLHLLTVGHRKILIATTRDNVVRIADLSDTLGDITQEITEDI
jgi:flagellar biogenesis protein FliO